MSGASNGYSIFSLLGDIISSTDSGMAGLLLVGGMVAIIILALRAAGKGEKEKE